MSVNKNTKGIYSYKDLEDVPEAVRVATVELAIKSLSGPTEPIEIILEDIKAVARHIDKGPNWPSWILVSWYCDPLAQARKDGDRDRVEKLVREQAEEEAYDNYIFRKILEM
jgi:hypothetical protein